MKRELYLNFIPIMDNFFFEAYIKKIESNKKDNANLKLYRLGLGSDKYTSYSVSFIAQDSYEKVTISSSDNIYLTNYYLLNELSILLSKDDFSLPYEEDRNGFRNNISFTIEKYIEGEQRVIVEPYFLKKCSEFGFLISFKFFKYENVEFSKRVQQLSLSLDRNYKQNFNYYNDIYKFLYHFIKEHFVNINLPNTKLSFEFKKLETNLLEQKEYTFASENKNRSQFVGLSKFGPFNGLEKEPHIIFVFTDNLKNFANDLFLGLKGKTYSGVFSGVENFFKFSFDKKSVERISIKEESVDEVLKSINDIQDRVEEREKEGKSSIVLFLEYDVDDKIPSNKSPYYRLKLELTKIGIPLQTVSYKKHSGRNGLKWSLSSIALQIFAKLGGVPWLISSKKSRGIILGVGTCHKKDDDTITKYSAYTLCLDSSGSFKSLRFLSEGNNTSSYIDELKTNLKYQLENLDKSSDYICLHLTSKIKRKEIEAIREVVSNISDRKLIVLKINPDNKFFAFSNHNTKVPHEGEVLSLSDKEYLLWFKGLLIGSELVKERVPSPVHVEFLYGAITDEEKSLHLKELLDLSGADWKGFRPAKLPISISYSKTIAKYIREFDEIEGFQIDNLNADFPWFL